MLSALRRRGPAALRRLVATALLAACALVVAGQALRGLAQETGPADGGVALMAAIEGGIGPASDQYLTEALEEAEARGAALLILRLDTPGGLVSSTRDMIQKIIAAPVPVIGYVAPSGAHAASAGTYILYATHVAAMAPGTNIGAATPVTMGGAPSLPGLGDEPDTDESGEDDQQRPADAMTAKMTNDAVAFLRSLAELRGRNADWAEKAVRQAATATASQALDLGAIEIVAEDAEDLLAQLDGRTARVARADRTLATDGLRLETIEPSWLTSLLGAIANPNVALPLMMIGIYGLIFEFAQPGSIGPGIIGGICLILGLYALNQLPLNHAGFALIALGAALMVMEALTPSFGVLGLGGIVAFLIGGAFLIDTGAPEFQLSLSVLIATAALSAGLFIVTLGFVWRTYRRPAAAGAARLIGARVEVLDWSQDRSGAEGEGFVWAEGERWRARGPATLAPGVEARVVAMEGLTLTVEAA